uniref:GRAM domain-containing protein n=1 Tax=Takifugu rubripes TaxID=31033 RepID=A0A674NDL5_TAKRU
MAALSGSERPLKLVLFSVSLLNIRPAVMHLSASGRVLSSRQKLDFLPVLSNLMRCDLMSCRLQLIDDLSYEDVKKCYRGSTVSKYNSQYHKLFQTVPKEEILMKVYSCALLRDILLQGRLYISRNWLCFYANLFGKDIKVCIPVVSVRLVKKHKTAGLVPNGLAITMDTGQKYVFVSLLSRDSVYDVLRRICTHLQVNGKSLSLKQYLEEPSSLSMVSFPEVLKWRKPSLPDVSSSLPDLLGNSSPSLTTETPFSAHALPGRPPPPPHQSPSKMEQEIWYY